MKRWERHDFHYQRSHNLEKGKMGRQIAKWSYFTITNIWTELDEYKRGFNQAYLGELGRFIGEWVVKWGLIPGGQTFFGSDVYV